jgi:hypothetical protein
VTSETYPFARLDHKVAEFPGGRNDCLVDEPKVRSVRVLRLNELIGRGGHEVRVSEPLHDQESRSVSGHVLLRKPSCQTARICEFLLLDARIPVTEALAGLFFQDTNPHVPVGNGLLNSPTRHTFGNSRRFVPSTCTYGLPTFRISSMHASGVTSSTLSSAVYSFSRIQKRFT